MITCGTAEYSTTVKLQHDSYAGDVSSYLTLTLNCDLQ